MSGRKTNVDRDESLIAGAQKYLVGQTLTIGKQSYTPQQIVDLLQGRVTAAEAVVTAKAGVTAALKAEKDERTKTGAFVRGFTTIVLGMYSELPDTLAVFGLKPRKSTKKTVETLSTAIAKNKATRKARGTKGKRQKEDIKGTIVPEPAPVGSGSGAPSPSPKPTA